MKSTEKNKDFLIETSTITLPSMFRERFYDYPQFVSKRKRFKCCIYKCDFIGLNIEILKSHIFKCHPNFWCYM